MTMPVNLAGEVLASGATEQIAASERILFEAMPQLGWVADAEGWIGYYNQRWYTYTGTTPEQMAGWGWQSVHDPHHLPAILEGWRIALASGTPFQAAFPLRRWDGVFRWFMTHATPVHDSDGKVARWIGINTDIDDQRRAEAEQALERQAARLRIEALFNDAPAAICLLRGSQLVIEFANPRIIEIWHRSSPAEVVGKPLLEVFPELRGQGFDGPMHQVMATGEPYFGTERPVTVQRDGASVTVVFNFVYVPNRDAHGVIGGVSVFAFDVTPQVQAKRALEAAVKIREDILAIVSHDLRNPLGTILLAASQLEQTTDDGALRAQTRKFSRTVL